MNRHWNWLNLEKNNEEDYITYVSRDNKECEKFKQDELMSDRSKCQLFTQGLNIEVRARILTKLEQSQAVILQQISEECERIVY